VVRHNPAALALALALTLGTPLAALAGEPMRVVRDPVTGELRGPTAAEVAAFQRAEAQLRKAPPKPQVDIQYPDGTIETKMGDDTLMYSVVRANEDGSLAMACLPAKEAKAFLSGAKPAATSKARAKALTQAKTTGHNHD
jgi:hypothetical protein